MAAGVDSPLVVCRGAVGASSFPQSILSPNGLWRLERGSETEEHTGGEVPFLHLGSASSGERIWRLYHADWEDTPYFYGHAVTLGLNYCGYRCRVKIDAASRTFVFHPHEWERPLEEMHAELDQAMRSRAKIYVPRSKRRKTTSAWSALFVELVVAALFLPFLLSHLEWRARDWPGILFALGIILPIAASIYSIVKRS